MGDEIPREGGRGGGEEIEEEEEKPLVWRRWSDRPSTSVMLHDVLVEGAQDPESSQ